MGRVYKALVRAGRIADELHRAPDEARGGETNAGTASDFNVHEELLSEQTGHEGDRPRAIGTEGRPRPAASNLRVADFSRGTPDFVEPLQSFSIRGLEIDQHLAGLIDRDDLARERYNTLAVRLINLAAKHSRKSLLITSALEGEGKTTVAANLAWVMAKQSGKRVLLLDADLRRPSICRMLGLRSPHGLMGVVEGRSSVLGSIVRIKPHGMYVLADRSIGDIPNLSAGDVLTSSSVENVLNEIESLFDFVIIDAPPITEFADAQRLAGLADGTVLVVRAGRTHHNAVTDALKLVPKDRRVGVVLNVAEVFNEEVTYYYGSKNKRRGWLSGRR